MTERTRVFVATPCFGGDLKMAYVLSALKLQAAATARGIDIQFHLIGNESLIVRARNELAHQFLVSGASHLLFIDADIGFEPEAVFRLLDCGTDVAAAAYPLKHIDWAKCSGLRKPSARTSRLPRWTTSSHGRATSSRLAAMASPRSDMPEPAS
jgi:hypothetical protein